MAAEAQQLYDLFDFYWFRFQIFSATQNQIHNIEESIAETNQNLDSLGVPAIDIRSYSDQLFINSKQLSDSVLNLETPKLETIFSGKEVKEIEEKEIKSPVNEKKRVLGTGRGRKRYYKTNKNKSKSLSELEFEELKGFMDLGFLFSEKDKESNLVSIIPGLQRLGEKEEEKDDDYDVGGCRRPYLSQAWDNLEAPIIIPATLGNDMEIKHQLKFWAHSVASAVR